MEPIPIVLAIAAAAITLRVFAGALDTDRVRAYVEAQGGKVLAKHWTPFGRGWFGSQNERIYRVRYQDAAGEVHEATCKTSAFAGVYFTQDRVVSSGAETAAAETEDLVAENRALRAELDRLKGAGG